MFKLLVVGAAVLLGSAPLCSACLTEATAVSDKRMPAILAISDTAVTKLAITGMTCGSCATTARLVLQRVPGVYHAAVTHDSSSAVITYDPTRTKPATFIAKLTEMTGYSARVAAPPPTTSDR